MVLLADPSEIYKFCISKRSSLPISIWTKHFLGEPVPIAFIISLVALSNNTSNGLVSGIKGISCGVHTADLLYVFFLYLYSFLCFMALITNNGAVNNFNFFTLLPSKPS